MVMAAGDIEVAAVVDAFWLARESSQPEGVLAILGCALDLRRAVATPQVKFFGNESGVVFILSPIRFGKGALRLRPRPGLSSSARRRLHVQIPRGKFGASDRCRFEKSKHFPMQHCGSAVLGVGAGSRAYFFAEVCCHFVVASLDGTPVGDL